MAQIIRTRRDIKTNWETENPVLALGEQGYETDTGKLKFGDGNTSWNNLPYFRGALTEELEEKLDSVPTPSNIVVIENISSLFKSVSYNSANGVLTFTQYNDTIVTVDLPLELIVSSGHYDSDTKSIILVLANQETITIPVSDLVNEYYADNTTLELKQVNGKLTFNVKDGVFVKAQTGKGLSTNDYSTLEKNKLAGIASGAQVNKVEKILINGVEQSITDKTVNLEVKTTSNKIYGIKRSLSSNTSSAWERTDDSVGLVANATKDGSSVVNNFDSIYPSSDIITYNYDTQAKAITAYYGEPTFKFDGSNGEVLTRIPEFYYKRYVSNNVEYILISREKHDGFIKSEQFSVGRYTYSGSASRVYSRSGYEPFRNYNITNARAYARALGDGFGQLDWHYLIIQMLYLVEYANYNCQSMLGQGRVSSSTPNNSGGCDTLGMKSGCLGNDGTYSVIYRGIEDPYGNIWQFIDGINVKDHVPYVCYDSSKYAVDTFDGAYHVLNFTMPSANGYASKLGYDSNNPLMSLTTEASGSSTTNMCDYYYQNDGNRIALVGGYWGSTARAGLWYWNVNEASSNAWTNVGARLLIFINYLHIIFLAPWQKLVALGWLSRLILERSAGKYKNMEPEMKRKGNIYNEILELNNIESAIFKASVGKTHRKSVEKILDAPTYYAMQVQKMLSDRSYIPSPYIEMKIRDGASKKERIVFKPRFYPDQIIHWSLMNKVEPLFKRGMYEFCCASIKGRGIQRGMNYVKRILVNDRKHTKYCLKLDIKKFYPSIDKEILKKKFRKIIKDKDTLYLMDLIVDSSTEGVPIGNFTSQWFANYYLQDLDHYIKEELKVKYYIRYMDDMVLFSNNKKELRKCKYAIDEFLAREHLRIKENWQLFKTDSRPIDFLGYRFYRGYTTLRRSNFLRIKRRIKKISKKEELNFKDACAIMSYNGWIIHSDSYNYTQKYLKPYVDFKKVKEVIKNENRKHNKTGNKI